VESSHFPLLGNIPFFMRRLAALIFNPFDRVRVA
jgi:hypothetical protein